MCIWWKFVPKMCPIAVCWNSGKNSRLVFATDDIYPMSLERKKIFSPVFRWYQTNICLVSMTSTFAVNKFDVFDEHYGFKPLFIWQFFLSRKVAIEQGKDGLNKVRLICLGTQKLSGCYKVKSKPTKRTQFIWLMNVKQLIIYSIFYAI